MRLPDESLKRETETAVRELLERIIGREDVPLDIGDVLKSL